MPELPEITLYVTALDRFAVGRVLRRTRLASPFLLRTYDPPLSALDGRTLTGVSRIGKRIVLEFETDVFAVLHLMIAGRLRWKEAGVKIPRKFGHAAFDFEHGSVLFTEAGTSKRASLHVVRGRDALTEFDRGGLEPLEVSIEEFAERLLSENRTLKRALTDPRLFSGIGNAHSDEILLDAHLSPITLTRRLDPQEIGRLYDAVRTSLREWITILQEETGDAFPDRVTAFHPRMKVHGRHGQPCPVCGSPIQRIAYANNETNYCARCQTGGRVLADRALSRLLRDDFPRTLEELEER
jgi:formamidopyrimidine-DNA glycosylase